MLGKFAAQQGDAAAQISAALKSGDQKLAERIAHTLKGVAANLGVTAVAAAAEKLERAVRDGNGAATGLLDGFASCLEQQVGTIRQALQDAAPKSSGATGEARFDAKAAQSAAARLRSALEHSDAGAADEMDVLVDALGERADSPRLKALRSLAGDYDFEGALVQLGELERECGLSAEKTR